MSPTDTAAPFLGTESRAKPACGLIAVLPGVISIMANFAFRCNTGIPKFSAVPAFSLLHNAIF